MKQSTGQFMLRMVKIFFALSLVLTAAGASVAATPPAPQDLQSLGAEWRSAVLLLDPTPSTHRVAPPLQFFQMQTQMRPKTATIIINYQAAGETAPLGETCETWPNDAKIAFDYAASIWESLINSSVPIVVNACWTQFSNPNVLGYGGADYYYHDPTDFTGAPMTNTWYPSALANAIHGSDLDNTRPDMHVAYGKTFDWYFGTDGNPPASETDFASVVLHEICHGLGFSGSMRWDDGVVNSQGYHDCNGTYGAGCWSGGTGYPISYDRFTEDNSGTALINTATYPNPSVTLGNALTSENVWFNGSNANAANSGGRVRLYAPSTWKSGSSYSHLDEIFNGTSNSLMTYSIGAGEAEHSPGPIALGMLKDMGWTLDETLPAPSVTSITPNTGVNTGTISITNLAGANFQNDATVKLTRSGQPDIDATNVMVVSDSQITCDFDLTGAAVGQWNVVVTNPDAQSGQLDNGFTITAPPAPDVSISKSVAGSGSSGFEPGDYITFTLAIANEGDAPATDVTVSDDLPAEILNPSYDSTLTVTPTGAFSYTWAVEELGAGANGVINIYGQIDPSLDSDFSFVNTASISDPGDVTPANNSSSVTVGEIRYDIYLPLVMKVYPPVPATPVLYAINNSDGDGNYTVSWSAAERADTYLLQEDDNTSFSNPSTAYSGSGTSTDISGKSPGTYYYRVKAINSWEGEQLESGWSNTRSVFVQPPTTFYAVADACILQGYPNSNAGSTVDMWAGYDDYLDPDGRVVRSLIKFNTSAIPANTSIANAVLRVYLVNSYDYPGKTRTITTYRINSAWSESNVTWNTSPSIGGSYGSTGVTHGSWVWYSFNVTDLVRGWVNGTIPNHGVMLRGPEHSGSDSSWKGFSTREGDYTPQLVITYSGYASVIDTESESEKFSDGRHANTITEILIGETGADSLINRCPPGSPAQEKCLALP